MSERVSSLEREVFSASYKQDRSIAKIDREIRILQDNLAKQEDKRLGDIAKQAQDRKDSDDLGVAKLEQSGANDHAKIEQKCG